MQLLHKLFVIQKHTAQHFLPGQKDFVVGLSALARGTAQDKLRWAFSLYDLDGDGVLSKDELYRIIWSIYDLLGRSDPYVDESAARIQAETVFKVNVASGCL